MKDITHNSHNAYKLTGGGIKHLLSNAFAPHSRKGAFFFFIFLFVYCIGIVCYSRYTFNLDDIWMWLKIYESQPIFNGYTPSSGRFFPLASLDLNLIAIFSHSPYAFFTFNALIVFGIGVLLWIIFALILEDRFYTLRVLLLICIFLHPGFVTIMLGICYPERLQVLFLSLFIFSSIKFYRDNSLSSAIIGFISANAALYYKEPTFLIIGSFGLLMFIDSIKNKNSTKAYLYYGALTISALIFLVLYFTLIIPHIEKAYTREIFLSKYEEILHTLKGLLNFILNDSILLLLLPSLFLYRIYMFIFKHDRRHIFWDSLLLGGFLYLCAFIKLHLFELYYLIPIYFVSLSAMLYFLYHLNLIQYRIFKSIVILCAFLMCINTIPMGIYSYITLKVEGIKFHDTLAFVAHRAKEKANTNQTLTLYFEGNGRGENYATWYWGYFAQYLETIYHTPHFDIKTKDENSPTLWEKMKLWHYNPQSPLSIYNNDSVTTPQSGDLIILNSSTIHNINAQYIEQLTQKYRLVYASNAFGIPYIALKPLLKTLFRQSQTLQDATQHNQNIFKLPLRDYIFEVP